MKAAKRVSFRPIAHVVNEVESARYDDWDDVVSDIVLDERLAGALDGIEEYSHVMVLFYISGVTRRQRRIRRLHPRDRQDAPLVGVFATRTQYRPNPIGVTVARLVERQGNRLRVLGLDAYNGTPVMDIKACAPDRDLDKQAHIPQWLEQLRRER
jgi:tRNA-Thr(GGU) m(6)t(6)A37 methyltransferase TsaA